MAKKLQVVLGGTSGMGLATAKALGVFGVSASGGFDAIFDSDNYKKMLDINLGGVFWMMKYGYAECAKGGHGSIIPVGSLAS